MTLSIIINHYRKPHLLRLCLQYLEKNLGDLQKETEIIVADGGALNDTAYMMRTEFPGVMYIPFVANVGFSKLVNAGIDRAQGKYVFVLNADIILPKSGLIEQLITYMEQNPDIGMIEPQLRNFNGSVQQTYFDYYTPMTTIYRRLPILGKTVGRRDLRRFLMRNADTTKPLEVFWLMGSAFLMRTADVRAIGKMDDRFFMYFEDVDLCRRFKLHSKRIIYYPLVSLYHYHQRASNANSIFGMLMNPYTWIHLESAWKYFQKYHFQSTIKMRK